MVVGDAAHTVDVGDELVTRLFSAAFLAGPLPMAANASE
jgi:hypothetical protein